MAVSSKQLFQKYLSKVNQLNKDKNVDAMYQSLLNGKNSYLRMTRKGSSSFDPTWITVIEDCLYDLGEIVNNPREVTKTDSNITPVELAKKVNGESVQHLASHTQYIKEVNEKGEVVPSKILSHTNVEDIHTYENRFIATFIRRLMLFVAKRYEFIKDKVSLTTDETLMMKNTSYINGQQINIETKVTIKREDDDATTVSAKDYIDRILAMREYISYYYNSPFMKKLKNEKDVRNPIIQTNIIRKNPKYHRCYETYLFIERFDTFGVSYKVDEKYQDFNEEERKALNYVMLSSLLAVQDDKQYKSIKENTKTYKPRILSSIDDEEFTYGDIVKGPIEFVRVDETYRAYLRSKINPELPERPNKHEYEYYRDDYDYRKENKLDERELDKLIARKAREKELYDKVVEKLVLERQLEDAAARKRELEAIRRYEENLIEIKRRRIIEAALRDRSAMELADSNVTNDTFHEVILRDFPHKEGNLFDDFTDIKVQEVDEVPSLGPAPRKLVSLDGEEFSEDEIYRLVEEYEGELPPEKEDEVPSINVNEFIYHVLGEGETSYVDGHKEEIFYIQDDEVEQVSSKEENEDYPLEDDPYELGVVYHVSDEAKVQYINGHKEETFYLDDDAEGGN